MGIVMVIVCFKPHSIELRKCVYYTYVVYCILQLLSLIISVILILAVDAVVEKEECYYDCVDDALRVYLLIAVIVWACIYIPITLICLQIVYWGWKE